MKSSAVYKMIVVAACAMAFSGTTHADESALNLALPSDTIFTAPARGYVLASNDDGNAKARVNTAAPVRTEFKEPTLTGNKVHQYLGLGTLALVGLTAMTAPDGEDKKTKSTTGIHPTLGRAAAAMAAATVTTGLLYHSKDIHLEDGLSDPDNMHAMLAGAGALAMLYAISRAPNSGHSGAGVMGGIAMGVAVKLTW
ncbi:MAG: hypothetical protein HY306_06340 [Nitrosomonadales bacterium]|nr:hypothetical protein [Nitrosomonadales bacterium]